MNAPQPASQDNKVWTESFTVRAFEMDVTGHLGVLHLFNYFQEVAGNHARALGVSIEALQAKQLTWMMSRFHVQVERYPSGGETLTIETWPSGQSGLHAVREFLLYTQDGSQIGKGTSGWLIIDLQRYRPIRMPDFIEAIELPDRPRAVEDPFNKLSWPLKSDDGKLFSVGYYDLDINQHANSMHAIRWALEAIPEEVRSTSRLKSLEVQFRSEARYGDEIVSYISQDDQELTFRHGLCRKANGKELVFAQSKWG